MKKKARLILRKITRSVKTETAREKEEKRQALEGIKNNEKLLRLAANISSDLKQEERELSFSFNKPPPPPRSFPRSPPSLRRRSYDSTSLEEEETEEQA